LRTQVVSTFVAALSVLFVWVLFTGCSSATGLQNGLVSCTKDTECPDGYYCAGDGRCWQNGASPALDASAPDGMMARDAGDAGDGAVACPGGFVECATGCVNPQSDPAHCGATTGCGVGGDRRCGGVAGALGA